MKKIVLVLSVIAVAILVITLSLPGEHGHRMAKIDELKWEALDNDTVKYATTQRDIDSLLKRVDKEYAKTDDHYIKMDLIRERQELEDADMYNSIKHALIILSRIERTVESYGDTIISYVDLHRDPGQKSVDSIDTYTRDNDLYHDLHRDPGRNA
jgi:hypothetical protein